MKYIISISLLIFAISSCTSESPFLTKEDLNQSQQDEAGFMLAYIMNNNLYIIHDNINAEPKQLTSDYSAKSEVKINASGTKIAYLSNSNSVVVIDLKNSIREETKVNPNTTQIGWVSDEGLYYFDGNKNIYFIGNTNFSPISISFTQDPDYGFISEPEFLSASYSSNGQLAFIAKYYTIIGLEVILLEQAFIVNNWGQNKKVKFIDNSSTHKVFFNNKNNLVLMKESFWDDGIFEEYCVYHATIEAIDKEEYLYTNYKSITSFAFDNDRKMTVLALRDSEHSSSTTIRIIDEKEQGNLNKSGTLHLSHNSDQSISLDLRTNLKVETEK